MDKSERLCLICRPMTHLSAAPTAGPLPASSSCHLRLRRPWVGKLYNIRGLVATICCK